MKSPKKARIEIRISMEESDFARSLAKEAGITISDFFRDGAMKGQIVFTKTRSKEVIRNITGSLSDLVFQMQMIGNNLNQIARSINADKQNNVSPDYQKISESILGIDASITQTTDIAEALITTLQNVDIANLLFKVETIEYDAKDKTYVKTYEELQRIRSAIADNTLSLEEEQKQLEVHDSVQTEETAIKEDQKTSEDKPSKIWIDNFEMPDWSK